MFSDILENELKPIVESLDNILTLDEKLFTEDKINQIIAYVSAMFNQQIKQEMVNSYTQTFREQFFTEEEAREASSILVEAINEYLSDYGTISDNKQKIVNVIIDSMKEAIEEAIQKYFQPAQHKIFFELIHPNAKIPSYAHETDAGADIYIPEDVIIPPAARGFMVHTGLKAVIPNGWEIQIRPRSGLSSKTALRISNAPGTIDAGYRGEICVLCDNLSGQSIELKAGDRIAQMVFSPVTHFIGVVTENVANIGNNRGGGFGSSINQYDPNRI